VESGKSFTFNQLQLLGRVRGEIVIGYRKGSSTSLLNPLGKRDTKITLSYALALPYSFSHFKLIFGLAGHRGDDRVIVIAEDNN
jgi:hypothetical protein